MNARHPIEVFPPGEYIKDELEARGWSQSDLAAIMGRQFPVINEIIAGKRAITRQTAIELGDAFGTGPDVWVNLEATYRLGRVEQGETVVSRRARLYKRAPIREMIRRRWIEHTNDIDELEKRVAAFFERTSIEEEPAPIPFAPRMGTDYAFVTPSLRAWLYRARKLARSVQTAVPFTTSSFARALTRLAALRSEAAETRHIPNLLAECGIRLVVVEHLAGTRIDGTCFWLDETAPVVAISLRYDRLDWFWFTLIHELGHVEQRDGLNTDQPIDLQLVGEGALRTESKPEREQAADRFATEFLIPQAELENFINRVSPLFSKNAISGFAARLGIHPALVVGQLAWRGQISYAHSRDMLAKARHHVTESALTDGWGHVVAA
jgi:HTH-type transcriptional regulator/antitoxin HigA